LVAILQEAGGIEVIGTGANGEEALRLTHRLRPDVITLDIRMPKMDGLEATRQIMREVPTPIVIVTGSLMQADRDLTFEALRAGALTVVIKPGLADPEAYDKVIQSVRLMADVPVVHRWATPPVTPPAPAPAVVLPTDRQRRLQLIGIASSTGGPAALANLVAPLTASFPLPILVVQHVTRGFASGLAEWLNSQTALTVSLASHGDIPRPGTILLAPDDYHLQVNSRGIIELSREPPYKGLRPSANYLFRSLALAYGPRAMGIVLTGMGDDGTEGLEALHRAGGLTIAQNEQSCVVYGMPREAINHNAVDRVLSLDQIGSVLDQLARSQGIKGDI